MINLKPNSTVVFIGDSISDVKFNRMNNCVIGGRKVYSLQFEKFMKKQKMKLKVYHKGIASNRAFHVYDRLKKDCLSKKPDYVVILIGVNDAYDKYNGTPTFRLKPFEPNFEEILIDIKKENPDVQIMVLLPFLTHTIEEKEPFRQFVEEYDEKAINIAKKYTDTIVDLQKYFDEAEKSDEPKVFCRDAVHPTNKGHELMCKAVLDNFKY